MGAVRTFCLMAVGLCAAAPAFAQQPAFMGPPLGYEPQMAMMQPMQAGPMGPPAGAYGPGPGMQYPGPMAPMGPMPPEAYMGVPAPGYGDCGCSDCGCGPGGCGAGCDCGCDCPGDFVGRGLLQKGGGGKGKGCAPVDCSLCAVTVVGVEAVALVPTIRGNSAAATFATVTPDFTLGFNADSAELDDQITVSPRVFAQVQRGDWGVAARYFRFSEYNDDVVPLTTVAPLTVGGNAQENLYLETADFELTRCWTSCRSGPILGGWVYQQSAGVRYAKFDQDNVISAVVDVDPQAFGIASVFSETEFEGLGVTAAISGRRQAYRAISFFWAARGSLVWGDSDATAQSALSVFTDAGNVDDDANLTFTTVNNELFIGEAQFGLQYEQPLTYRPGVIFLRTALEYQYWSFGDNFNAVANSVIAPIATTTGTAAATGTAVATDTEVQLIGIAVSAGIMW